MTRTVYEPERYMQFYRAKEFIAYSHGFLRTPHDIGFEVNHEATARAGYTIYKAVTEDGELEGYWVSDLGDRLEANAPYETLNIVKVDELYRELTEKDMKILRLELEVRELKGRLNSIADHLRNEIEAITR